MNDLISRQAAIDVEGLDEQIRCEMCRNPMHTNRGCDGNCKYDEKLYERIMQILGERIKPLSSAQLEPICINLNEPIKVKLTDWGKRIYYHRYDRINRMAGREICKARFPREDENGYTEFQLWCFIELYGEHMGMTLPNVIEPLEIVYER